MKVNGTLINYYFHCKRQCYLHGNRLNLEDNSEQVKIGKAIHEERAEKRTDSSKERGRRIGAGTGMLHKRNRKTARRTRTARVYL